MDTKIARNTNDKHVYHTLGQLMNITPASALRALDQAVDNGDMEEVHYAYRMYKAALKMVQLRKQRAKLLVKLHRECMIIGNAEVHVHR